MLNVRTYKDPLKEASLEVIPIKHTLQNEDRQLRFEQKTHKMSNTSSVMEIKIALLKVLSPTHDFVSHESTANLIIHHSFTVTLDLTFNLLI